MRNWLTLGDHYTALEQHTSRTPCSNYVFRSISDYLSNHISLNQIDPAVKPNKQELLDLCTL